MVKRTTAIFTAALALLCLLWPTALAADTVGDFQGSGTLIDPYLITSVTDLRQLRDYVDFGRNFRGVYFAQTEDLAFPEGEVWNPIGDLRQNLSFQGVYDGRGHTISNIHAADEYAGLFAHLGGEVRNLGIESGLFEGTTVGSITSHGTNTGKIINCYNKAEVQGGARAGGLTDNFPGLILFSWNLGQVSGTQENTVTAGITSYGPGRIQYSYCVGAEPVSDRTFSGELLESRQVSASDMAGILHNIQNLMGRNLPEPINGNGIAAMEVARGSLVFSGYESVEARYLAVREQSLDFDGAGTERDPFLIQSVSDLERLRDSVNFGVDYTGYYFAQTSDLTFPEGLNWKPIGEVKNWIPFRGSYDGRGHTLNNLRCVDEYAGFFGALEGDVRNLGIESGYFEGVTVGSITSHGGSNARIINCYNKAEVQGGGRAGGLCDNFTSGSILYSWNLGDVSGTSEHSVIGGLVSYGSPTIRYSYATAEQAAPEETFNGVLEEAGTVAPGEIPELLETVYVSMANDDRRLISKQNIVFLQWLDGTLAFSDSVPDAYSSASMGRYIPVAALGVAVVALGVALGLTRARRSRKRRAEKEAEKKTDSDESDAEPDPVSLKTHGKRLLSIFLTVAIFLTSSSAAFHVLTPALEAGIQNFIDYGKPENEKTDVLFLGSSGISCNVEFSELWKNFGIASYCLGSGGAAFYDDYYRLVAACKARKPKFVILEVQAASTMEEHGTAEFQTEGITPLPLSANKLRYTNAAAEPAERLDYFLTFPIYHTRYTELTNKDFMRYGFFGRYNKGQWTMFMNSWAGEQLPLTSQESGLRPLTQKSEAYLREIISYCQNNGIGLMLLKTPDPNRTGREPLYNAVGLIAKECGVPYLNMDFFDQEIGFEPDDIYTDFYHLNIFGARKCANFLGNYLRERFQMPDHRSEKGYESWDFFTADREDSCLRWITDNSAYFAELARDQRQLVAIPFRTDADIPAELRAVTDSVDALSPKRVTSAAKLSLGGVSMEVRRSDAACSVRLDGKTAAELSAPGLILVVFDPVLDEIADVAVFSAENQYAVRHCERGK